MEDVCDREGRDDRKHADDEAVAKLGEMVDETCFLIVAEAPRHDPAGHPWAES